MDASGARHSHAGTHEHAPIVGGAGPQALVGISSAGNSGAQDSRTAPSDLAATGALNVNGAFSQMNRRVRRVYVA